MLDGKVIPVAIVQKSVKERRTLFLVYDFFIMNTPSFIKLHNPKLNSFILSRTVKMTPLFAFQSNKIIGIHTIFFET